VPDSTTYDFLSQAHDLVERSVRAAYRALDAAENDYEWAAADEAVTDLRTVSGRLNSACVETLRWDFER
jgi:hypothetical protein